MGVTALPKESSGGGGGGAAATSGNQGVAVRRSGSQSITAREGPDDDSSTSPGIPQQQDPLALSSSVAQGVTNAPVAGGGTSPPLARFISRALSGRVSATGLLLTDIPLPPSAAASAIAGPENDAAASIFNLPPRQFLRQYVDNNEISFSTAIPCDNSHQTPLVSPFQQHLSQQRQPTAPISASPFQKALEFGELASLSTTIRRSNSCGAGGESDCQAIKILDTSSIGHSKPQPSLPASPRAILHMDACQPPQISQNTSHQIFSLIASGICASGAVQQVAQ